MEKVPPVEVLQQLLHPHVVTELTFALRVVRVARRILSPVLLATFLRRLVFVSYGSDRVRSRWELEAFRRPLRVCALRALFVIVLVGKPSMCGRAFFFRRFGLASWTVISCLGHAINKIIHHCLFWRKNTE